VNLRNRKPSTMEDRQQEMFDYLSKNLSLELRREYGNQVRVSLILTDPGGKNHTISSDIVDIVDN
jgi:hypothetical protein